MHSVSSSTDVFMDVDADNTMADEFDPEESVKLLFGVHTPTHPNLSVIIPQGTASAPNTGTGNIIVPPLQSNSAPSSCNYFII